MLFNFVSKLGIQTKKREKKLFENFSAGKNSHFEYSCVFDNKIPYRNSLIPMLPKYYCILSPEYVIDDVSCDPNIPASWFDRLVYDRDRLVVDFC